MDRARMYNALRRAGERPSVAGEGGMSVMRAVRRKVKAAAPPFVFLALVGYFGWNATQGDLGLKAYKQRQEDLASAQAGLAREEAEVVSWERRVRSLEPSHLDTDALDERSRAMLNLANPGDIVVPYSQAEKLF
jgi:cell division protein FtsB